MTEPAAPGPEAEPEALRAPRDELREGLARYLTPEQVSALIDEVLAIRKKTWADCPKCRGRVMAEVLDARSVAAALKDLLAEGFGKPRDRDDEAERIVFTRNVIFEGADAAPA